MSELRSDLTDIYTSTRGGAYGDFDSYGCWVYARGPDGKTRQCTARRQENGNIIITAHFGKIGSRKTLVSHFASEEWQQIAKLEGKRAEQLRIGNEIMRQRRLKQYLRSTVSPEMPDR